MKIIRFKILTIVLMIGFLSGCHKFLSAKSDKQLEIPSSIQDLQALIDYYFRVNNFEPGSPVTASDDYYLTTEDYLSLNETDRNMYVWNDSLIFPVGSNDWSYCYDNVYRANVVLDNLRGITRTKSNAADWDNLKGQALFLRGKSFLEAVVIWALAYDSSTANKDLGIPLRLNSDFNSSSVRSSVQQSYGQIISDIESSINLLPVTPVHVLRSSRPAACALLARAYLAMRNYDSCFKYANECLQMKNTLLDYNTLDTLANYPVSRLNAEVIMENNIPIPNPPLKGRIDSSLFLGFNANDLRKTLFFNPNGDGTYAFGGSYEGTANLFGGIATDEVYLMRAECYARKKMAQEALNDLNTLLIKRYKKGTFMPISDAGPTDVLPIVLTERRKELIMRGLRWMDIKRLNKENAAISPERTVNDHTYILTPNSLDYALAIPEDVINASAMLQNPR